MVHKINEAPVTVTPTPLTFGDEATVLYNGFLGNQPGEIYLHKGYGRNDSWKDIEDIKMTKTPRGWKATFKVNDRSRLNMCFKNDRNVWDNNYGHNWSYEIHDGKIPY
ncbi:MAG: hypothetical protein PWQ82_846 [Thermosediminibacterales bacterium]|nr:hypothetical protein [Thermosediminibacterales bacterium]MDK2835933.1 hypothetical protein [Thermosediminibacterales bacterium]